MNSLINNFYDSETANLLSYTRFITKLKYLAYSSEVGEAFRHTYPKLVKPCYAICVGYIGTDIVHYVHPFYDKYGWTDRPKKELGSRVFWHSTASLFFPTLAIGSTLKTLKYVMKKTHTPVHYIRWALPAVAFGMIFTIVHPIDHFVEENIMPPVRNYLELPPLDNHHLKKIAPEIPQENKLKE